MAITNVQVKNTNTNLLLVPPNLRYAVTAIMICNTATPDPNNENANTVNVDMHFTPSGTPKSNNNMVINKLELRAGETFSFDTEKIILDAGDKVILIGNPTFEFLSVPAGFFEVGKEYEITSLGTLGNETDWNSVANTTGVDYFVGDRFIAQNSGNGNGDGEAKLFGYTTITATASYLEL